MFHFVAGHLVGMAVGFVIGAFSPAVGRKIKAAFVAESHKVEAKVASSVKKHL